MRVLADRIEAGEVREVSENEIDAVFDDAERRDPRFERLES